MQTQSTRSLSDSAASALPNRETVAEKLAGLADADKAMLTALMTDVKHDECLFAGIELYLDRAAHGRFLHTIKLENAGLWLGQAMPDRLQIRLNEIAKSSHHPAFAAFRAGVSRSGGLERAYPRSRT